MALKQASTASGFHFAALIFFLALLFAGIPITAAVPIQQGNETNSTGVEWSLVTGTRTLLFYSVSILCIILQ